MLTAVCSFANETKKGNEHFSKGNYAKAILHYKNELDERDEDGSLSYRIALCHLLQGNQMKAHSFFNRAKARNPNIFDGKTFKMPSGGMKPTLLVGDHIIVDIEFYDFSSIKRNDVVALENPKKKDSFLIKRIIGLPGEKLKIKNNEIFIENKKLKDTFGIFDKPPFEKVVIVKDYGPVKVPKHKYFVLGDNRNFTFDSRHFGFVSEQGILGKVLVVYASLDYTVTPPTMREERVGLIVK